MNDFSSNGTNRCKICNGLGYVRKPSINAIVDFDKKIKDIPFKCWNNSYQDYYKQILFLYCEEMNINLNTSLRIFQNNNRNFYYRTQVKLNIRFLTK